ncbi:MAG: hypothetical protein Q4C38_02140 [bacterium]|nr:hypothetical protein [bacterium]
MISSVKNEAPVDVVKKWLRNNFISIVWKELSNESFKGGEFDTFKNEAGSNTFKMSPQKWIRETNAIGIISEY